MAWIPFAIMGGAQATASIIAGHSANQTNREIANANNATSIELANTAHQREVKDLYAAGLNPMLSYRGSGAATPVLQQAHVQDPVGPGVTGATTSAFDRYMQMTQREAVALGMDKTRAEIELTKATQVRTRAETLRTLREAGEKIPAEVANIGAGTAKTQAEVGEINTRIDKMNAEVRQIAANIDLTKVETRYKQALRDGQFIENKQAIRTYEDVIAGIKNGNLLKKYEAIEAELGAKAAQASWRIWLAEQGLTLTQIERVMGALPNVALVYPMKTFNNTFINPVKK